MSLLSVSQLLRMGFSFIRLAKLFMVSIRATPQYAVILTEEVCWAYDQNMPTQEERTEQQIADLIAELERLNEYTEFMLTTEGGPPEGLLPRKQYLHGLLALGLAFSQSAAAAAKNDQVRGIIPELRSLQEAWIGARFAYCTRSHVWMFYVLLQDELDQKEKRDRLHAQNLGDPGRYAVRSKEALKIIHHIEHRYPELPLIPQVITPRQRGIRARKLSLKDKCRIIDYYQSQRTRPPRGVTMVEHYETVYGYFSQTTHATPSAINDLYRIAPDGTRHLDVSGKTKRDFLTALLVNVYLYQAELLDRFCRKVATRYTVLPDDIKATIRRIMASKK